MTEPYKSPRLASWPLLPLLLLTFGLLWLSRPPALRMHLSDESLYVGVARNIAERFDFNSQHYISESVLSRGYPTKDTHTPGYPMILAAAFALAGPGEAVPYFLNYFLLALAVSLIFVMVQPAAGSAWAIALSLVFLAFPLTIPFSQTMMTETASSTAALGCLAVLLLAREGAAKGLALALLLCLNYLIKPLSATLILPLIAFLSMSKAAGSRRTLGACGLGLLALIPAVLWPLSQNRETYPFAATQILSQTSLAGKIAALVDNLKDNFTLLGKMNPWSGDGLSLIAYALVFATAVAALFLRKSKWDPPAETPALRQTLLLPLLAAFILTGLAVLSLYDVRSWRASRALSFFAPLLIVAGGLEWHARSASLPKRPRLLIWGWLALLFAGCLGVGAARNFSDLRKFQLRDYYFFNAWALRVETVLKNTQLKPRMIASHRNFFLPVREYPSQLLWTLPKSLKELEGVAARAPLDLIEVNKSDPLYLDNLKVSGTDRILGGRFPLVYEAGAYLYYGGVPVLPDRRGHR